MANYEWSLKTGKNGVWSDEFAVIETVAPQIKPLIICKNVCDTAEVGINACFFTDRPNPGKTSGLGISWYHLNTGNDNSSENREDTKIARGTLCGYVDSKGKMRVYIAPVKDVDEMKNKITQLDSNNKVRYMVGGGSLFLNNSTNWSKIKTLEGWTDRQVGDGNAERTGIGYRNQSNGTINVYLVISTGSPGMTSLRNLFKDTLKCDDAIFLDGGGSSQMRCYKKDGSYYPKRGDGRNVWNMVSIISAVN